MLLEVGMRRCEREGTPFSYQNAIVAEHAGNVVGMLFGPVWKDFGRLRFAPDGRKLSYGRTGVGAYRLTQRRTIVMRLSSVTGLAMLAMAAYAAPAPAEEGTFTACLTRDGELRAGALGLEPQRPCRRRQQEIHFQTDEVTRFNFEIAGGTGGKELISTDEFGIATECDGGPILVGLFQEDTLITVEQREGPIGTDEIQDIRIQAGGGDEVISLLVGGTLVWYEAYFTPAENPTYIALLRLFARGDLDSRCRFSGEVRIIELPELEVLE